MAPPWLTLCVLIVLITWQQGHCDNDDEEIKGPLMKVKPDGGLFTTAEIIELNKYKSEVHKVTTADGYILSVFRVLPSSTPSTSPVLLQHGFLASSDVWVTDPDAFAFKLSNDGFDVWISNFRGNAYSRNHIKLKPEEKDFWNFSYTEWGTRDLPAVIDYILQQTNQSALHYVGHSMGTTASYVMASTRPEYNTKLKSLIGFAPIAYMSKMMQMVGPGGMVEDMASNFMKEFKEGGKFEVFPRKDYVTNNKTQITCQDAGDNFEPMCEGKLEEAEEVLGGSYLPAGTSFKSLSHLYQMFFYGELRNFNLSTKESNQKEYGSEEPPKYSDIFNKITTPTLLWTAQEDPLVGSEDVSTFSSKLPNLVSYSIIKDHCFGHVSFLFTQMENCIPTREKVYKDCIEAMKKIEKK